MSGSTIIARLCLAIAIAVALVGAQTIAPANYTSSSSGLQHDHGIALSIANGTNSQLMAVVGLTTAARDDLTTNGQTGTVLLMSPSNADIQPQPTDITLISCDPPSGYLGPYQLFSVAVLNNPAAVLLYTTTSDYCDLQGYSGSYTWIYSTKNQSDTNLVLSTASDASDGNVEAVIYKTESGNNGTSGPSGPGGTSSSQGAKNPLGSSPTTALAMIVLYAVTGLITALFLVIIVTGAIRAHRHPERYGRRSVAGRPRQSRAKGLARAMLDTLPIVKFTAPDENKTTDTELAETTNSESRSIERDGEHGEVEILPVQEQPSDHPKTSVEVGIAAATEPPASTNEQTQQGCSICTEDFEPGQDQRVLPCDHRFHPECVDPWLLNVSGTCPLCRIDLRPGRGSTSSANDLDENGDPALREGEFEPPPLGPQDTAGEIRRMSIRRSIIMGIIGRPDRMSREERVLALRQLRGQRLARRRREEEAAVGQTAEEESAAATSRVRNVLVRMPSERPARGTGQSQRPRLQSGESSASEEQANASSS